MASISCGARWISSITRRTRERQRESVRVRLRCGAQRLVVEAEVVGNDAGRLRLSGERALARLPRTDDRRCTAHAENVAQLMLDRSSDQRPSTHPEQLCPCLAGSIPAGSTQITV